MPRPSRSLPAGHSFRITLRCISSQFLITKRIRRDVLLVILEKAKQKTVSSLWSVLDGESHPPAAAPLRCCPTAQTDALGGVLFRNAAQPPHWALRALLGGKVLRRSRIVRLWWATNDIYCNTPIRKRLIDHISTIVLNRRRENNKSSCFILNLFVRKVKLSSVFGIPDGIKESKNGPVTFFT